jgi:hypothetical protein
VKALTVQQPWAWAIAHGGKMPENRTQVWAHRGDLAIHAGARWSERGGAFTSLVHAAMTPFLTDAQRRRPLDPAEHTDRFAFRAVVAVVNVTDCHRCEDGCCPGSPWAETHYTEHGGRLRGDVTHLVYDNVRPLDVPVPCTGMQGMWTLPGEVEAAVRAQVGS